MVRVNGGIGGWSNLLFLDASDDGDAKRRRIQIGCCGCLHLFRRDSADLGCVVGDSLCSFSGVNRPGVLYRTGWTKNITMKPGDTITVFGWRARDGTNWAHSREVTLPGGKKLFFGPPAGTGDGGNAPAVEVR